MGKSALRREARRDKNEMESEMGMAKVLTFTILKISKRFIVQMKYVENTYVK